MSWKGYYLPVPESKLQSLQSPKPPSGYSSIEFSDLIFHEEVGRGGYGIVHRVTFRTPQPGLTQAAAKELRKGDLKEEVNILETLDHPNIVKLYGCLVGPVSLYFILLEYADKGTVRDYLKRHEGLPIPVQLLKKWARESALALQYLHRQRVLHRDVKASNCLLFEDNILKLSDFGLAREMEASETTSTAKGTWRYMAPEINTDNYFSFKSDIYAYGMLVLEIGTGKVPFNGLQSFHVMYRVSSEYLKPTIPPDFPTDLGDIIWRSWSSTPKLRPELAEALDVIDSLPDDMSQGDSASASPSVHSVKQWDLDTEFGKKGDAVGEFQLAYNTAVCSNGDVTVVDYPRWKGIPEDKRPPRRVFIFTSNGKFKLTLTPPEDQPEARLVSPSDVAITSKSNNHIAVSDAMSIYVKLFNGTGTYLHSFSVLSDNADPNTRVEPCSISVACNGDILVGCAIRKVITIHESHNGRLINTVNLSIRPHYITTNSKQQIIVCDWEVQTVQIFSYSGDVIVSLDSCCVEGKQGMPTGVTCDVDDCIYIAVRGSNPADGKVYMGSSHIHQYSPCGRFLRCIVSGMYSPLGITWHKNSIYVANKRSVLVYSQK